MNAIRMTILRILRAIRCFFWHPHISVLEPEHSYLIGAGRLTHYKWHEYCLVCDKDKEKS